MSQNDPTPKFDICACCLRLPDSSWKIQSTKIADLDLTIKVATRIYGDIRWSVIKGLPLDTERKFNAATKIYTKQLRNGIKEGTNKAVYATCLGVTNIHTRPSTCDHQSLKLCSQALLEPGTRHMFTRFYTGDFRGFYLR